jgi:hypothetical protein
MESCNRAADVASSLDVTTCRSYLIAMCKKIGHGLLVPKKYAYIYCSLLIIGDAWANLLIPKMHMARFGIELTTLHNHLRWKTGLGRISVGTRDNWLSH